MIGSSIPEIITVFKITTSTRPMLIKIIILLTHSQVEAPVSYYKLPTFSTLLPKLNNSLPHDEMFA